MASPLSWFRRNQKGMLVVFGVLLMASFGLGSVMYSLTPRGVRDTSTETPVVEWQGGTLTNGDLSNLRYRHFRAMNFLQQLQQSQFEQRGATYQPRAAMLTAMNDRVSPDQLDRQVMYRLLSLEKAREIGLQVSNDAVMQYLRALADDQSLSHRDMDRFAGQFFNNSVDFIEIRDQLKLELAIEQINLMADAGVPFLPTVTEAWQDFQKLENRVECEALEFPVADYVSQVSESPSTSELRQLYDQGKYRYPDIAGELPGFKRPRKLAITMLTADYNDFLERAKLAITPEQIQEEYDRLVAIKDPLVTEIVAPEATPTEGGEEDPPPSLDDALMPEGESDLGDPDTGTEADDDSDETNSNWAKHRNRPIPTGTTRPAKLPMTATTSPTTCEANPWADLHSDTCRQASRNPTISKTRHLNQLIPPVVTSNPGRKHLPRTRRIRSRISVDCPFPYNRRECQATPQLAIRIHRWRPASGPSMTPYPMEFEPAWPEGPRSKP